MPSNAAQMGTGWTMPASFSLLSRTRFPSFCIDLSQSYESVAEIRHEVVGEGKFSIEATKISPLLSRLMISHQRNKLTLDPSKRFIVY